MMITIDPEDVRLSKSEREFLRRIALKLQADAQNGWREVSFTDEQLTAIRGGLTAEQ